MKMLCRFLIISLISAMINLTGCSSIMSNRMPAGSIAMTKTYNEALNGGFSNSISSIRSKIKSQTIPNYRAYTRTPANEISAQFHQLPNPNIVMYIFPHEAENNVPIPGYSTVFPLYTHVHYAMPRDFGI